MLILLKIPPITRWIRRVAIWKSLLAQRARLLRCTRRIRACLLRALKHFCVLLWPGTAVPTGGLTMATFMKWNFNRLDLPAQKGELNHQRAFGGWHRRGA